MGTDNQAAIRALIRAVENAITYFIIVFVTTAPGLLLAADLSDTKAVKTALVTAALGAAVGALKELTGFSTMRVTERP